MLEPYVTEYLKFANKNTQTYNYWKDWPEMVESDGCFRMFTKDKSLFAFPNSFPLK